MTSANAIAKPTLKPAFSYKVDTSASYLVKGLFAPGQISLIFGASNVGKTFFCTDLAYHVYTGEVWNGCRVKQGKVLYIATEGHSCFDKRMEAIKRSRGVPQNVDENDWLVLLHKINLHCSEAVAALDKLLEGHCFDLVIIDTLAMALGAGSENENTTYNAVLRHLSIFRKAGNTHVMLVHHPGKDQSRGARGHSSLQAAVDTEVLLKSEDGLVAVTVTKQRDHGREQKLFYALDEVVLGEDQEGDPITSCVVRFLEHKRARKVSLSESEKRCLRALKEAAQFTGYCHEGNEFVPPDSLVCDVKDWQRTTLEDDAFAADASTSDSRDRAFRRARQKLVEKGLAGEHDGECWEQKENGRAEHD